DGQRANLADRRRIEVQRAAACQRLAVIRDHKVPHVLRKLKFRAREHDALRCVTVDEIEQGRDVLHARLAYFDIFIRDCGVLDQIGSQCGDHAVTLRPATIRVPISSPAKTRLTISESEPRTILTSPTPCETASVAALSLACMPPVATPSSISFRQSSI